MRHCAVVCAVTCGQVCSATVPATVVLSTTSVGTAVIFFSAESPIASSKSRLITSSAATYGEGAARVGVAGGCMLRFEQSSIASATIAGEIPTAAIWVLEQSSVTREVVVESLAHSVSNLTT